MRKAEALREQHRGCLPWAAYSVRPVWRNVVPPVAIAGKLSSRYQSVEVTEYLNLETGEIVRAADAEEHSIRIAGAVGQRVLQRDAALSSLKPESRDFARFCLRFRNKRRGVTPGFRELCRWYSELTGKRADNVRRCLPSLERAGIIAGESLLGPLFQFAGKSTHAHEHIGEDERAEQVLHAILAKMRNAVTSARRHSEVETAGGLPYVPEWDAVRYAEREVAAAFERYVEAQRRCSDLMRRLNTGLVLT
ncbi:hypothetical protein M3I54_39950 [Paraburkholderia sp. CNPSo 3274]|uniref:hypothetical protein n=1 Tax=Paraburkholderia sp. CNPSo 3274 TaxID=2940932 RepID=UPI0020B80DCA|nr:hypothetical protein [Paraburkholderia sp. CNPSo 3274]MCP3712997.1 hypothetical protein [Paraburkholderia sp. CNPSo 3274]